MVATDPGIPQVALALAVGGRVELLRGRISIGGVSDLDDLQLLTRLVDVADVTAPEDSIAVRAVVQEELALAERPATRAAVAAFLAAHDLSDRAGRPWEQLPAGVRTSLLLELGAMHPLRARPGPRRPGTARRRPRRLARDVPPPRGDRTRRHRPHHGAQPLASLLGGRSSRRDSWSSATPRRSSRHEPGPSGSRRAASPHRLAAGAAGTRCARPHPDALRRSLPLRQPRPVRRLPAGARRRRQRRHRHDPDHGGDAAGGWPGGRSPRPVEVVRLAPRVARRGDERRRRRNVRLRRHPAADVLGRPRLDRRVHPAPGHRGAGDQRCEQLHDLDDRQPGHQAGDGVGGE